MYREIITPTQPDFTIHLPNDLIGKKLEVIVFEIEDKSTISSETSVEEKNKTIADMKNFYNNFRADFSNFKFNRDEANER